MLVKNNKEIQKQVKLLTSIIGIGEKQHGAFWHILVIFSFFLPQNKWQVTQA